MAKVPKDLPKLDDRVGLKGRGGFGVVSAISDRMWVDVDWLTPGYPKICHLHELERLDAPRNDPR